MGDPTDQVRTVDTTGLAGHPNVEEALVAPALLEAAEEAGEEGLSEEEREELPLSLAEQKTQEGEAEGEGEGAAEESGSEVAAEEAVPEEVPAEEEAAEEEAEVAGSGYDPGDHSVVEVVSYLQNHPEERDSVIALEKAGKDRKGITSLEEEG